MLKRVISACKRVHAYHLLRHHILLGHHTSHLLLIVFYERRFHHVYAVLSLYFITVMKQESLVTRKLFLNRLNWYFINGLTNLESVHSGEQFFSNV